jgi:hypothetical protein
LDKLFCHSFPLQSSLIVKISTLKWFYKITLYLNLSHRETQEQKALKELKEFPAQMEVREILEIMEYLGKMDPKEIRGLLE